MDWIIHYHIGSVDNYDFIFFLSYLIVHYLSLNYILIFLLLDFF